ncbi:hypothetical protein [Deinococcus sp. SL84]|uniref:hypothetical protein n=1 Tax=Deinococcus sp. SL84 TaxID=2994663 RepID=UPI002273B426|nr:hypothetical protein [Deinococcus sp. SL84]MCY1704384.1 hypothetical protein [Deinococcus sp. SL84]
MTPADMTYRTLTSEESIMRSRQNIQNLKNWRRAVNDRLKANIPDKRGEASAELLAMLQ